MLPSADALRGRHILIVEDEYFIASDVSRSMSAHGAKIVGPVGTVKEALDLLDDGRTVDGAVLDINLRGEHVYPVADRLAQSQVPFLFLTGYDAHVIPPKYSKVIRCEKPLTMHKIVAALS
jgi:CheY-like chemotaxis protein